MSREEDQFFFHQLVFQMKTDLEKLNAEADCVFR